MSCGSALRSARSLIIGRCGVDGGFAVLQSHPIQVDGVFIGAAIRSDDKYRFVATDVRLEPLDESMWPSLADVQRVARHVFRTGRFPERVPDGPNSAERPRLVLVR